MDERSKALSLIPFAPESLRRLDIYVDLLARWRRVTNLISEHTFNHVWTRHIADSAQLLAYAPRAERWIDLGSGAGFPGMVIAMQLIENPNVRVHCIESDQRKCAFLREVARATGAPVTVHPVRREEIAADSSMAVDVVTARALAPLPRLVELAKVWLERGAVGLFPRGRTSEAQMNAFSPHTRYQVETFPSKLDAEARIVRIVRSELALT